MEVLFWVLAALVIAVYAGYPALLYVLPRRDHRLADASDDELPDVVMLISAYNEAACIEDKLRNSVSLDYPAEKLRICVISDASDDGTDEIVRAFEADNVELLRMEDRGGKTLGLNEAVAQAEAELVVFSDANAMYESTAIRTLAESFADPDIGAVIGESTYGVPDSPSGQSESLYWRYETFVKKLESQSGSVVGGDGAIYAVRRNLYVPMAAGDLSDFVNPLQVVKAGYRCIYEPAALSYEEAAESYDGEFRRKVRIVNRAWRALWKMRAMLNPARFGMFSVKLWLHKVLRWLVPAMLVAVLIINLGLVGINRVYQVTLVLQVLFYLLAVFGYNWRHRRNQPAVTRIPYYFCLVNVAAAVGLIDVLRGRTYATWTTVRG